LPGLILCCLLDCALPSIIGQKYRISTSRDKYQYLLFVLPYRVVFSCAVLSCLIWCCVVFSDYASVTGQKYRISNSSDNGNAISSGEGETFKMRMASEGHYVGICIGSDSRKAALWRSPVEQYTPPSAVTIRSGLGSER